MIDLEQYRSRIGQFCPKSKNKKFLYKRYFSHEDTYNENCGKYALSSMQFVVKLTMFLVLTSSVWSVADSSVVQRSSCQVPCSAIPYSWSLYRVGMVVTMGVGNQTGNFWARYVNGNRINVKGIKNMHFNIRKLKNKVDEVKNIIKQENPNIFGLSECDLRKENCNVNSLKIPGYVALFPKSWNIHGFARVVVYVKKSLHYEQVFDLEHDLVQSIWVKGGYKNGKKIYFCHAYREHSSIMGDSINSQKDYLNILLGQWEAATTDKFPTEPNELHVR